MKSEAMLIRVPDKIKRELKESAEAKGYTVNGLILEILWKWYESKDSVAGGTAS